MKHGKRYTKEYEAWQHMKQRCTNPKSEWYHRYGGRGISVCDRWLNSFELFLEDVGKAPSKDHSLDRFPNRDGNYEPNNVRWATTKEQNDNKDWVVNSVYSRAVAAGIKPATVYYRIRKMGWTLDEALSIPPADKTKNLTSYKRSV